MVNKNSLTRQFTEMHVNQWTRNYGIEIEYTCIMALNAPIESLNTYVATLHRESILHIPCIAINIG